MNDGFFSDYSTSWTSLSPIQNSNNNIQYLNKKIQRNDYSDYYNANNKKKNKIDNYKYIKNNNKNSIHQKDKYKQLKFQSTLNDFFPNRFNSQGSSLNQNNFSKESLRLNESFYYDNKNNLNSSQNNIMSINHNKYKTFYSNDNMDKSCDLSFCSPIKPFPGDNNPFNFFANIVQSKSPLEPQSKEEKDKEEKHIFTETEILEASQIEKEYIQIVGHTSDLFETDILIKSMSFFITKGINEKIRLIFYKCLINYGYPLMENFNTFYNNFLSYCTKSQINYNNKMCIEFYTEYISFILSCDRIEAAKNKLISEFFFNNENIDIIKSNLNLINAMKENGDNVKIYLTKNYDRLFSEMNVQINREFIKSKLIVIKMIYNVLEVCDKFGYLDYKNYIDRDLILFTGIRIKGNYRNKKSVRKMISAKVFGREFSDAEFITIIEDYFLQLFSHFDFYDNNIF